MKKIHIVLLPSDSIMKQSISVSNIISGKTDAYFSLNSKNALPHITLSQINIKAENEKAAISDILTEAKKIQKIHSRFIDVGSFDGWVWLCTEFSDILHAHKRIITSSKYAKSTTAEPFLPHLTITRITTPSIKNEMDAENLLKKLWENFSEPLILDTLAIGYPGEHGVFKKLVSVIALT